MLRLPVFAVVSALVAFPSFAQEEPVEIDEVEAATRAFVVQDQGLPPTQGILKVSGDRLWPSFFVSAERIEFEPGARLIFTPEAIAMRGNLFVLANEIVSLSQENPGTISWNAEALSTPPDRGSATSAGGYPGDEAVGARGPDGGPGNPGYAGNDAPSLTMIVGSPSSPIIVDLAGQPGGRGGKGEAGGRGGVGGNGLQGSQSLFDCKRGAGDGGRGGQGGTGGPGGLGGTGGDGGTFTLVTSQEDLALASSVFRVRLAPGPSGEGGNPGEPGPGGDGGQGGQENLPYCRGNGSAGQAGNQGGTGSRGKSGAAGQPGDYIIGGISTEALKQVLKD